MSAESTQLIGSAAPMPLPPLNMPHCPAPEYDPGPEYIACPKAGRQRTTTANNFFIAVCSTRNHIVVELMSNFFARWLSASRADPRFTSESLPASLYCLFAPTPPFAQGFME